MRVLMIITVFVLLGCKTFQEECSFVNVRGFTKFDKKLISIYKNVNGELLRKYPPDEEAGWMLQIIGSEGNYFKVNIADLHLVNVWILKGKAYLNTRNYDGQIISLYQSPNKKSVVVSHLKSEQTVMIVNVCNDWALVKGKGKGKKGESVSGWLEPDMQCDSPYTTCP